MPFDDIDGMTLPAGDNEQPLAGKTPSIRDLKPPSHLPPIVAKPVADPHPASLTAKTPRRQSINSQAEVTDPESDFYGLDAALLSQVEQPSHAHAAFIFSW